MFAALENSPSHQSTHSISTVSLYRQDEMRSSLSPTDPVSKHETKWVCSSSYELIQSFRNFRGLQVLSVFLLSSLSLLIVITYRCGHIQMLSLPVSLCKSLQHIFPFLHGPYLHHIHMPTAATVKGNGTAETSLDQAGLAAGGQERITSNGIKQCHKEEEGSGC